MFGYIKFYIPVKHPKFDHQKLVCIGTVSCDYTDRDKVAVDFVKQNKNLPIVEATFLSPWALRAVPIANSALGIHLGPTSAAYSRWHPRPHWWCPE